MLGPQLQRSPDVVAGQPHEAFGILEQRDVPKPRRQHFSRVSQSQSGLFAEQGQQLGHALAGLAGHADGERRPIRFGGKVELVAHRKRATGQR